MAYEKKDKKQNLEDINEQYGRIPPQALDFEESVLGAIMLEKNTEIEVLDILRPESFYKESHQKIFKAIQQLSLEHDPIDVRTVVHKLRQNEDLETVGGPYYISKLTQNVGSAAHLEYHSKIIAQKYIQRELIRIATEIHNRSYNPSIDVDDLLDFSEKELFNLAYGNIKNEAKPMNVILKEAVEHIEELSKRTDGLSGVPSGFTSLDRVTMGWQPSDLVIVAARPSMGKTAFVLSMARNMAVNHQVGVALFSLEMSSVQLVNRLVISETELPGEKIKTGKLEDYEWIQLEKKIKNLDNAPVFIDDTPAITLFELRAKCRRLKMQNDIKIIIIDYLQLMSGTADVRSNREQEVSQISRGLKALAKELNVPIIALSQLNRSVEMRSGDKRPQLSDLRESGAIEQDADIVIFIHRPEKFGILEDAEGNSTQGLAEIIIAKHRNGAVTDVNLRFRGEFARFEEFDATGLSALDTGGDTDNFETVTFGSKMNDEPSNTSKGGDPFANTNFDDEAPF